MTFRESISANKFRENRIFTNKTNLSSTPSKHDYLTTLTATSSLFPCVRT